MSMKKVYLILAAAVGMTITSCTTNDYLGDVNNDQAINDGSIQFGLKMQNMTRAGEFVGATAADKLGNMFVVEGTKGSEQTNSPSTTVVFDNYLVGYTANTAGTTASNTHNWEYVGLQNGITGRMTSGTWNKLHETGPAKSQTIKYWDYSTAQYDFYAYSTGTCEAVPTPDDPAVPTAGTIQVSRINQVTTAAPTGFTMRAASAEDLKKCYYTDINKVLKGSYGQPVTLTFRNMTAKVRMALYETVPGYSVKSVEFYQDAATALDASISANEATLFTMGDDKLPQSGTVTVLYPRVGSSNSGEADYNKASVTVTPDAGTAVTTQGFGTLTAQYGDKEANEAAGTIYLGRTLPNATFAGSAADSYYKAVIPNTDGKALTLRVNYTLVATDGSGEEIKVYGAKAVVPPTYTKWLPNYAYTYIFKISDNSNGRTSKLSGDPEGLFPITFDAVVANFVDANAEQTTVTTVATPSITTYQQGHNTGTNGAYTVPDEYDNNGKKLYVQVMDNSSTPALVTTLSADNSLLFSVASTGAPISEATVMDALVNRTNAYNAASPIGRNGITLTTSSSKINNAATSIVNGVDNQPISVTAGKVAEINLPVLSEGTYAYVYVTSAPSKDERIYQVAAATSENYTNYYTVALTGTETPIASTDDADVKVAQEGKVYFVKNVDKTGEFVSYTFKQTKVGDDVVGLVSAVIPGSKASGGFVSTNFYFDVYNQNNGEYAVKVIKVVDTTPAP